MTDTTNFFKDKKPWSKYKDSILGYYLTPYIAKILYTKRPVSIIDCFAGKGRFEDGEEGSPIIIAKQISNHSGKDIKGYFIEKKYNVELRNNIKGFTDCIVLGGTFEENIQTILGLSSSNNIFVYVDPYGVKSLNMNYFQQIKDRGFNSLEMLMNFNSFGFLREGCRLLKCGSLFDDTDIDTDYEADDSYSIDMWNNIAGGDYWQELLRQYNDREIDMYQCEEHFTEAYTQKLSRIFNYIVNIPIKTKEKNIPKYRLLFGTDHSDGLILMADNMCRAWNSMKEQLFQAGQMSLMFDIETTDKNEIIEYIKNMVPVAGEILLKNILIELIKKYNIQFSQSTYKDIVKILAENGEIAVRHDPSTTPTGRPVRSWDINKYSIYIKRN